MDMLITTISGTAGGVIFLFATFATKTYVDHRHKEVKDLIKLNFEILKEDVKEIKQLLKGD